MVKVNGILLDNLTELINILYNKIDTIIEYPIVENPSCIHYKDVKDMTSKYCPDCGKYNTIIKTGGTKTETSYELKDAVNEENGFLKKVCKDTAEFIDSKYSDLDHFMIKHVEKKLKANKFNIYISNYVYQLVADYNKGPSCLWIDFDGSSADVCKRCFDIDNVSINKYNDIIIISTHQYGYFCDRVLNKIQVNDIEDCIKFGFDYDLLHANKSLENISGFYVEKYKVKPYTHNGCFY